MELEYDRHKSPANKTKHGIDFEEAQEKWDGQTVRVLTTYQAEERWLIIGKICDTCWAAVVTYREARVRLISVRRARTEEVRLYDRTR